MRRRVLMVLLWLAGTFGATGAVFATVSTVSNDLFNVGDPSKAKGEIRPKSIGFGATTTVAAVGVTTTVVTQPPTTEPDTTTTVTEPPTTEPPTVEPSPVETTIARVGPTVRTTVADNAPVTSVPVVTVPPPTAAPPTDPPTTAEPPTTSAPAATCDDPLLRTVGRNTIRFRPCTDGLRYSSAVTQTGWTAVVVAKGPPFVTVTFSNGSTSLTCTLTRDGDGVVNTSGDC